MSYNFLMLYPIAYTAFAVIAFSFVLTGPAINKSRRTADVLVCLIVGLMVVMTFDICPFSNAVYDGDGSVFMYIGNMMKRGFVPYRDLFDHKGPWLFFFEFIGLLGGTVGLWLLELINISVTGYIILLITGLYTEDCRVKYITLYVLMVITGLHLYEGGNYTEVWALPWICLSLYLFLRFMEQKTYTRKTLMAIGFSFMVVFLLRCNLIAVWVVFIPAIIIELIRTKHAKEIIKCAVYFSLGMLVALLPVLIYYGFNNAIADMYKYYWEYNLFYVDSTNSVETAVFVFFIYGKYFWAAWIALLPFIYKLRLRSIVHMIFLVVSIILGLLSCRAYEHYFVPLLPCFIVPLATMFSMIYDKTDRKAGIPKIRTTGRVILSLGVTVALFAVFYPVISGYVNRKEIKSDMLSFVVDNTEPEDDVFFLSGKGYWSLISNRYSEQKFFYMYPLTYNDELRNEMLDNIRSNPPDYIIVPYKWDKVRATVDSDTGWEKPIQEIDKVCEEMGFARTIEEKFYYYSRECFD